MHLRNPYSQNTRTNVTLLLVTPEAVDSISRLIFAQDNLILGVSGLILLGKAGAALASLHFQEDANLQAPRRRSTQNP